MPSFLFCLDDIFENFVRNVLRHGLRDGGWGVADGNSTRNQVPLFRDNRRYPVKPDLIFRKARQALAAGEIKYKSKIEETDRYQLISHSLALNVDTGVWISPAASPADEGLQYVGLVGQRRKFFHYKIDLGADLRVASRKMTEAIRELLERRGEEAAAAA